MWRCWRTGLTVIARLRGPVEMFLTIVKTVKETGDFPKTEQQQQQSKLDELIAEGASKKEILSRLRRRVSPTPIPWSVMPMRHRLNRMLRRTFLMKSTSSWMPAKCDIRLADYVPAKWLPGFRVLKEGLKFQDDVLVATIICCLGAMLPPTTRIYAVIEGEGHCLAVLDRHQRRRQISVDSDAVWSRWSSCAS